MILGIDVGGTNIDGVLIKNHKIIKTIKREINYDLLFESIFKTIENLIKDVNVVEIKKVNLSTTISTNAIVLNKLEKVGLIIQNGPGLPNDLLRINKTDTFIDGYTDHRGVIVKEYNIQVIKSIIKKFKNENIGNVSIITKFSTRNNKTELDIKNIINKDFKSITMGHEMSGKLNFPRRINMSYLNEGIKNNFRIFAINIKKALDYLNINADINILKADGGIMNLNNAINTPIETIFSGPAASLMGILALTNNKTDAILLDIGGTTTDIFLTADGVPLFEPLGIKIKEFNTLTRSIFSKSISLGGDTTIKLVNNKIKIGPEKLDKPLSLNGLYPTITDALNILGDTKLGDVSLSKKGFEEMAKKLNISILTLAKQIVKQFTEEIKKEVDDILEEINKKLVYTIKELLEDRKIKPKNLVVIGASAKALSNHLGKEFSLPVIYPIHYEIANAIGAALAKTTAELNIYANTKEGKLSVPEMGILKRIDHSFNIDKAISYGFDLLKKKVRELGNTNSDTQLEVVEQSEFNMVDGFYTSGKNIRVKVQVKPGLLESRVIYD